MTLALPRLGPADLLEYDGVLLRIEREWSDGTLTLNRVRSNQPFLLEEHEQPTKLWLLEELAAQRIRIVGADGFECNRPRQREAALMEPSDWRFDEAKRVRAILNELDARACPLSNAAIEVHLTEMFATEAFKQLGEQPSPSTARKWMKTRGSVGNRTLSNCAPKGGRGPRAKRLDSEVLKLRTDAAIWYWTDREHSMLDAHAKHCKDVMAYNVERTRHGSPKVSPCEIQWLRKRIHEVQTYDTFRTKFGEAKANAFYKAAGLGVKASRFLEIGIIDHHTLDAFVGLEEIGDSFLPAGRPTVTAIYDVFTGCVTAVVHFTPPSLWNMIDVIKQANRPKVSKSIVAPHHDEHLQSIYGRFDTILPDNAWEFTGTSGQDSLQDLGCHIDWSRAGRPKDKAKLERWWGTLNSLLSSKLPATVFDPRMMRELGYDPSADKVIEASQLRSLLSEAIALYHTNIHSGMNAQPARLWNKEVEKWGSIPVIRNEGQLDQLMGMVEEKTLTTSGIKMFNGLWYSHPDNLEAIIARNASRDPKGRRRRGKPGSVRLRFKIKYNPADITAIHVFDPTIAQYVTLECREEFLKGLSKKHFDVLRDWAEIENLAFNTPEQRLISLATFNEAIRKAAPHVAARHRKKFASLVERGAGAETSGTITIAHVASSYSGMTPVTQHETAVATRTDGGLKPRGPKARKAKRRGTAAPTSLGSPTTGEIADFSSRASFSRNPDTYGAADDDWSGI